MSPSGLPGSGSIASPPRGVPGGSVSMVESGNGCGPSMPAGGPSCGSGVTGTAGEGNGRGLSCAKSGAASPSAASASQKPGARRMVGSSWSRCMRLTVTTSPRQAGPDHERIARREIVGRVHDIHDFPLEDEPGFEEPGQAARSGPFDASGDADVVDVDVVRAAVGPLDGPGPAAVFGREIAPQLVLAHRREI